MDGMKRHVVGAAILAVVLVLAGKATAEETRGTMKEAEALVKKAVALAAERGKDAAIGRINDPKGGFVDRDLYIFVIDHKGITHAHGFNQKLVGKDMIDLKDPDGMYFIKEFVRLVESKGEGWVDYKFVDPVTKSLRGKSAYVQGAGGLIYGCGVYR